MAFRERDQIARKILCRSNKRVKQTTLITWNSHCHTKEKNMSQTTLQELMVDFKSKIAMEINELLKTKIKLEKIN